MIRHSFSSNKYGAVRTERDGFKFDSQAEARYYDFLKAQQAAGEVIGFLLQVPFYLPGGVRYVADFQVFYADGTVRFVDVKGRDTKLSLTKRRMVEGAYPWIGAIEVVPA